MGIPAAQETRLLDRWRQRVAARSAGAPLQPDQVSLAQLGRLLGQQPDQAPVPADAAVDSPPPA